MKTIATALVALGLFTGIANARPIDSIFTDLGRTAPRSVFDSVRDSAPRSPFDAIGDAAPRSIFDQIKDAAPRAGGDKTLTGQDFAGE